MSDIQAYLDEDAINPLEGLCVTDDQDEISTQCFTLSINNCTFQYFGLFKNEYSNENNI